MILKEAKQKEKRQIKDAYIIGGYDLDLQSLENIGEKNSEEYYNQTFKTKWNHDYTWVSLSKPQET